jgi:hypothetical protein
MNAWRVRNSPSYIATRSLIVFIVSFLKEKYIGLDIAMLYLSGYPFQLLNQLTSFYRNLYESYATGGHTHTAEETW